MRKIAVIGAGPIGCYTAKLLAEKGFDVTVYEEDKSIGLPIKCTGLLSKQIPNLNLSDEIILNKIKKINIKSKNNFLEVNLKNPELIICREKFDKYISKIAQKKGVKIVLNHKFVKFENNVVYFENGKKTCVDFLIGADGPNSKVKKIINPNSINDFWVGIQSDVIGNYKKDRIEVYLEHDFKGFFGWSVPVNDKIARKGFASKKRNINAEKKLNIKNITGGLIPVYNPNLIIMKKNVALVGDAATHIKATTGGGLMQGIIASEEIANLVNSSFKSNLKKEMIIKNKTIKNKNLKIHNTLKIHLMLREILNNFNDKDYDYLLKLCNANDGKIKKIIGKSNRETPKRMLLNMIYREPRFLKYIFKIKLAHIRIFYNLII